MSTTKNKKNVARKSGTSEATELTKIETKINTWFSRKTPRGETNNGELITVPNQTMSIREILRKFTSIADVPGKKPEFPESDFSEIDKMDKFEKLDLARDIREEIRNYQKQGIPPQKQTNQKQNLNPSLAPDSGFGEGVEDKNKASETKSSEAK